MGFVIIERGGPADAPAAAWLFARAEARRVGREVCPPDVQALRRRFADPAAVVLLGRDGTDLIATALAAPARAERGAGAVVPGAAHVSLIAVEPSRWGRGHGGAILRALTEQLTAAGYRRLSLSVVAANARARALYERHGWVPEGDPDTSYEPMQWYVRSLP